MKLDAALPPAWPGQAAATARAAEQAGFAALWTTETQHDPFIPLVLAAEHTERLRLGTGIAVSFARSPATLAYTAWDLAAQSRGRFILGLGTQVKAHIERRFGMPWPESVTGKLREQIGAMRALWDCWQEGGKLNFRGEHYRLTLMSPFFNPGPNEYPDIPVYIAGVNTGLAHLAGEACQGFLAHPLHTAHYLREVILPAIAGGAAKAGRSPADVAVSVSVFVATDKAEREFCRQQVSFYASTPSYHAVMALHGWGEVAERLSGHAARGEWGEMPALISDEMLAHFCTEADSPTELAHALKARYEGLATRLTPYLPFTPGSKDAWWQALTREFDGT